MRDHRVRRKAGQEPAVGLGDAGVQHGRALGVGFPDQRILPAVAQGFVGLPVEVGVGNHGFRHVARGIAVVAGQIVAGMAKDRRVPDQIAGDFTGIGIQQQLGRVEAVPLLRRPGAVHPVAVDLAGTDAGQIAEPDAALHVGQVQPGQFALAIRVVQAQFDARRVFREQREVSAFTVEVRPHRVGAPLRRVEGGGGHGFVDHDVLMLLRNRPFRAGNKV